MIGIAIRDGPRHPWAGRQLERIGASVGSDVPDGQLIADTGIAVRDGPRHQSAGRGPPENERPGQLLDVIQVKATGTPASPSNETSKPKFLCVCSFTHELTQAGCVSRRRTRQHVFLAESCEEDVALTSAVKIVGDINGAVCTLQAVRVGDAAPFVEQQTTFPAFSIVFEHESRQVRPTDLFVRQTCARHSFGLL